MRIHRPSTHQGGWVFVCLLLVPNVWNVHFFHMLSEPVFLMQVNQAPLLLRLTNSMQKMPNIQSSSITSLLKKSKLGRRAVPIVLVVNCKASVSSTFTILFASAVYFVSYSWKCNSSPVSPFRHAIISLWQFLRLHTTLRAAACGTWLPGSDFN